MSSPASNTPKSPWLEDADVTLYHGDVLDTLRVLPAESVDCVVTSPPYWGLRDYGTGDAQIGLEPTPEAFVEKMVEVFREVRRVLCSHGTVWLNLGDSFQDKQLVGVPWKVAFALQADGWYLRSDIIWSKPNPMPESVTDRPTKAHEYVFLLSKQPRYFFDQEAVREAAEWQRWGDQTTPKYNGTDTATGWMKPKTKQELLGEQQAKLRGGNTKSGFNERWFNGEEKQMGRNIRSVWHIATQPYPEAHFATFPEELARRCIAAGCPEQVCRVCGKARERIVERDSILLQKTYNGAVGGEGIVPGDVRHRNNGVPRTPANTTLGFTDCECNTAPCELEWCACEKGLPCTWKYRPGIVLDPFMGSGTTAYVARKLGRHSIGIDLSAEYLTLAARRLQQQSLFAEVPGGI